MSATFGVMEAAIAFFVDANNGVEYSSPRDLGDGPVSGKLCIIDAAGEVAPAYLTEQQQRYTFRFWGVDDLDALDAYELTRAACYQPGAIQGILRGNINVRGQKWLKWFQLSGPTGPLLEEGTERMMYAATGVGKWST